METAPCYHTSPHRALIPHSRDFKTTVLKVFKELKEDVEKVMKVEQNGKRYKIYIESNNNYAIKEYNTMKNLLEGFIGRLE